ncbi:MAG: ATP-binding protein [Acidobacteriota bacterium]
MTTNATVLATDLHVEATYRLTEALVEAENQMRRRVNLLSEVVFETDRTGALVFLNDAWTDAVGYPPAQCLGQTLCAFVIEEDRHVCREVLAGGSALRAGGRPRIRLLRADGRIGWTEMSVSQLTGGGVVGALHDVTAEKQAQDEIAKLSLVASFTDNLVIITDREGRTEWVNQAFIKRTGYTLDEMIGRKPGDVLQGPDTDRAMVAEISEWLREGRSFKAELLNYTRSGEPYWGLFQITPIRNSAGEVERFVSIQTDSTELRRTRQELEMAKERAESASEAKTQFLATISHEMRTPLNVILGSTELALESDVGPVDAYAHLTRINANAEILLRLITDMLDVSKIEAGQFDFERIPVRIRPCLQAAVAPVGDRARAKGLDFKLMCDEALPTQMLGDPDRLRQIVANLAENAVKFTERGHVRVEVSRIEGGAAGGDRLEIRVADTGSGIAPDAHARIFERFEQADSSTTRRKGGAGLGLNIVKSLVDALGGHISVRSNIGEGAEFCVVLPMEPVPATEPSFGSEHGRREPTGDRGAVRPATILVAEDTDANFAVIEIFLGKAGYKVLRAVNGREAIDGARQADLILMDIEMPDVDGLEATRRIRDAERRGAQRAIPILALTAHAVQGYRERCLSAGCSGYLSKPIRKQALLEAVGAALADARTSLPIYQTNPDPRVDESIVKVDPELAQLVPEFFEYCKAEQARIQAAVEAGNWALAARLGHGMKGAGPSLGFDEVGRRGQEIEAAAKAQSAEGVRRELTRLAEHLATVRVLTA